MFRKSVMKRVRLIALAVWVLALVTVACAPQRTATLSPTATPPPAKTPTATPTQTSTPRPTDTPMPTPTPVPSLSGRVTDAATGQGVARAKVEIRLAEAYAEFHYSATTASDGSYAFFGLPEDDYIVRVFAPGYAREYYDNVTSSVEATIIHVAALHEVSGSDFNLTEGGSILGHVYQSDGITPIVGAEVWVRPGKYDVDDGFRAVTDLDGSYTIENLYLGNFRVTASARGFASWKYYDGVYGWDRARDVAITPPEDTSEIDIRLDRPGSISGSVFTSDGETPVSGVSVFADGGGFPEPVWGISKDDGSYLIDGIPPGSYIVSIHDTRYAAEWYDSKCTYDTAHQFSVSEGENIPNIVFTLDEGGSITGYVFDQDTGEPLADITLFAYYAGGWADSARTLTDGSYRFVLKPGEYQIEIGHEDFHVLGGKYIPEWYDNAYDMSHATLVSVALHQETSGIDFYLAKSGSISGHVYDEDGNPVSDARVYAFSDVYHGNGANTGSDGSYTIEGLPSGDYRVQAAVSGHEPQFYHSAADEASATAVTVNAPNDTPDIDFALSPVSE